jgi:antitoxin (DNA-binding transcriptional repressor) of toxin-antitoxin stability system
MPSTPTGIKFAPRPPRFTCAVAGALTIWARPTSETAGLNPLGRDLHRSRPSEFAGVGGGRKDARRPDHPRHRDGRARDQHFLEGCHGYRFCTGVPSVRRDVPPLVFHDLGVLVRRAVARNERPAVAKGRPVAKVTPSYTTTGQAAPFEVTLQKKAADSSAAFCVRPFSANYLSSGQSQFLHSRRERGSRCRHVLHSRGARYNAREERIRMNRLGHG